MNGPASLDLGVTGNCIISALIDRQAPVRDARPQIARLGAARPQQGDGERERAD